jgi:hypothetical protein
MLNIVQFTDNHDGNCSTYHGVKDRVLPSSPLLTTRSTGLSVEHVLGLTDLMDEAFQGLSVSMVPRSNLRNSHFVLPLKWIKGRGGISARD